MCCYAKGLSIEVGGGREGSRIGMRAEEFCLRRRRGCLGVYMPMLLLLVIEVGGLLEMKIGIDGVVHAV